MRSVGSWLLLSLLVSACASEYGVRVRPAAPELQEAAVVIEVALVTNCLSQAVAGSIDGDPYIRFGADETPPALGAVPPGNHGLFARFVNERCEVVAAGCEDIHVKSRGSGTLTVAVQAAGGNACGSAEMCMRGVCVPAEDGGRDAGNEDAFTDAGVDALRDALPDGPSDAGVDAHDAGPDATLDVGTDAGSFCEGLDATVCDDFEADASLYITNLGTGATMTMSTEQAHSGVQSARFAAPMGAGQAAIAVPAFDMTMTGERWARAWFYLEAGPIHLDPMSMGSDSEEIAIYTEGPGFTSLSTYSFGDLITDTSIIPIVQSEWVCLEMHVTYGAESSIEMYINSMLAADIAAPLTRALSTVHLGMPYRDVETAAEYVVFIDDLVMSTSRISCE